MQFEVTIRSHADIERAVRLVRDLAMSSIQVTHVSKDRSVIDDAASLRRALPDVDLGLNLSMRHVSGTGVGDAHARFREAVDAAGRNGIRRLLLVSGYPRERFDTLDALQYVQSHGLVRDHEFCVAYNPFFDPARLRDEHARLEQKLSYPFVGSVAIQIGVDTEKLRKGVKHIRSLRKDVRMFGEVPVPSKAMLQYLQKNPLYGVFLPMSYLTNTDTAALVTTDVLRVYDELGVEPIAFMLNLDRQEVDLARRLEKAR
jgi:hypothetical protein